MVYNGTEWTILGGKCCMWGSISMRASRRVLNKILLNILQKKDDINL